MHTSYEKIYINPSLKMITVNDVVEMAVQTSYYTKQIQLTRSLQLLCGFLGYTSP